MSSASRQIASKTNNSAKLVVVVAGTPAKLIKPSHLEEWKTANIDENKISVNGKFITLLDPETDADDLLGVASDELLDSAKLIGSTLVAGNKLTDLGRDVYIGSKSAPRAIRLRLVKTQDEFTAGSAAGSGTAAGVVGYIPVEVDAAAAKIDATAITATIALSA